MPQPDPGALLDWYDRHRRTMPWRALPGEVPDPYRVWLSEIMLQQTTVAAVIPFFNRFTQRFPTVHVLAAAEPDAVMHAWAGLGYYARARNLHACAKAVSAAGGLFPATLESLLSLPGIGPYTARAVAAIAFGVPLVPVDGNVERVASRLYAVETPMPQAKPALTAAAPPASATTRPPAPAPRTSRNPCSTWGLPSAPPSAPPASSARCPPGAPRAPPASPRPCRAAPPKPSARTATARCSG